VRAEGALAEWGYVAASRARTETRIYAVGPELEADTGLSPVERTTVARPLADALSRTAAESAVVEHAERERHALSPTQRARQRLEREIATRERLLASTRERLGGLGWIGRRRQGTVLRDLVSAQGRVLGDLGAELARLPVDEVRARPAAPEQATVPRTRDGVIRQPVQRGMGLER
jgi:hypothetical protein